VNTTPITFECVGSPTYVRLQCEVAGYAVKLDHDKKEMHIIPHPYIYMKSFIRKDKVNTCRFDVPEGIYCSYRRRIQVKPAIYESRWFTMQDGRMVILRDDEDGLSMLDLPKLFFSEYVGKYSVIYPKQLPYEHVPDPIRIKPSKTL
jgi:hypothetical protein